MIILNGMKLEGLSGDYINLHEYHILECRSDQFERFVLPGLKHTTPSNEFPYDYLWMSYIYKLGTIKIGTITYQDIEYCVSETLNWKAFCIHRHSQI